MMEDSIMRFLIATVAGWFVSFLGTKSGVILPYWSQMSPLQCRGQCPDRWSCPGMGLYYAGWRGELIPCRLRHLEYRPPSQSFYNTFFGLGTNKLTCPQFELLDVHFHEACPGYRPASRDVQFLAAKSEWCHTSRSIVIILDQWPGLWEMGYSLQ